MKKIINLVKVLFKLNINNSDDKNKKRKILLLILFGVYLLYIFSSFWNLFINPLKEIGQADISINIILSISTALIFMTSITYIINILYFTNDMENIIPLPYKPREIFAAKIIIAYLYELMISTMIALPGFLTYGVVLNKNIIYYIYALIVFTLLPIVPIIFLTIAYTLLMQFFKMTKYKNVFRIFSTVLILGAVLLFQMNLNSNMLDNGNYDSTYILQMCNNLKSSMPYHLKVAFNIFDNLGTLSSLVSLLWFILINVVLFVVTLLCLDKLYLRAVFNNLDGSLKIGKSKKISFHKNSCFTSLVNYELKKLFRHITFFIQCVLPTSFMPAVILISMTTAGNANIDFDMNSNQIIKMLFAFLIIQFFMMMNQISATAISRDGEMEASYYKCLPLSINKIIDAKAMPSVYVGLFNLVIAMIFNIIIFELNISEIIQLIIGGILLNFVQSYIFLIIDLKNPKLRWESDVAVVKHNMNVLKSIALWFGIIIVTSLIGNIFIIFRGNYFSYAYILLLTIVLRILKEYLRENLDKFYEKVY